MGRSSFTGRCAPRNGRQGAGPCGCSTRSARQRTAVPRTWPPPTPMEGLPKLPWRGAEVVGPYGKSPQPPRQAAHSGASAPRMRRIGGSEAGITPKAPATPDNPSVALRATAPFTQGSLSLGGDGEHGYCGQSSAAGRRGRRPLRVQWTPSVTVGGCVRSGRLMPGPAGPSPAGCLPRRSAWPRWSAPAGCPAPSLGARCRYGSHPGSSRRRTSCP